VDKKITTTRDKEEQALDIILAKGGIDIPGLLAANDVATYNYYQDSKKDWITEEEFNVLKEVFSIWNIK
jgi:hypothetical protein